MTAILVVVLLVLAFAPSAMATHVGCGDTITEDTTLDSDVVCEGETYGVTAITIAADGVTLDLAGHAVSGEPAFGPGSTGIGTDASRTGITVAGGTVRGFAVGVDLLASDSVIERVTSVGNGGVGFWVRGNGNVLLLNAVEHSAEFGISVRGDRAVLDRNHVRGMITCATVTGTEPLLTRNVLADCYWAGGVDKYTSAVVTRNTVTGNASGFGVIGEGAIVRRNEFSGNEGSGLSVWDPHAVVDRNVANENASEPSEYPQAGIEIGTAGAVVSRNTANGNGDYGIYAVPGVVDGGGNRARDNGNPLQCLNVACRR